MVAFLLRLLPMGMGSEGIFALRCWEFRRKPERKGRRWLGERRSTSVWKPCGANWASPAVPVEIRFNLRREEEYGVRGQIFGNAPWWESGRCVRLERIRRIRVSPGPEHFVLGSNEIIPDGTHARMGTNSGNCAGKSSSPALGRGLRSSNLSVATPRERRRRRRSRKNFHAESTSVSSENETLRRRRRDENLGAAGIRHGASGTAGKTPGKTSRRAARRVRFPGADRWTRGK